MIDIYINYDESLKNIDNSDEIIKNGVNCTLETLGYGNLVGEVSVTIVDSDSIHKLNKEYRGIDRTTDVLSFPLAEDMDMPYIMLGDIFINKDRIISQAAEYGHSVIRELTYLVVHSTLHLFGYDHIQTDDRKVMRSKEKIILDKLGIRK